MTAARITLHPALLHPKSFTLVETHWGYILRAPKRRSGHVALLRFLGIILVMSSFAQWLVPDSLLPAEGVSIQAAIGGAFATSGALLYALGWFGWDREAQIDTVSGEVRLVRPAGQGWAMTTFKTPFARVDEVFVKRDKSGVPGLWLRSGDHKDAIRLVTGHERELNLVHSRMLRDMRPPEARVEMRLQLLETQGRKVGVKQRRTG